MSENLTIQELDKLYDTTSKLAKNKVARFSYTQKAYDENIIDSPVSYSYENENNINSELNTDLAEDVKNIGFRSQGASIPREAVNHFLGRISMNLNKIIDLLKLFIDLYRADLKTNCRKWSRTVGYTAGDVVFVVKDKDNKEVIENPVVLFFVRNSRESGAVTEIPVSLTSDTVDSHWVQSGTVSNLIVDTVSYNIKPLEYASTISVPLKEKDAFSLSMSGDVTFSFDTTGIPDNTLSQKVIQLFNNTSGGADIRIDGTILVGANGGTGQRRFSLNTKRYAFIYLTVTKVAGNVTLYSSYVPY